MSALINDYLAGLHRKLPAVLAEEAAAGSRLPPRHGRPW